MARKVPARKTAPKAPPAPSRAPAKTDRQRTAGHAEYVRVGDLNIDDSYQRQLNWNHIQYLVDNWDDELAGVLEVGRRADSTMWIKDGQHRWVAAKMKHDDDYEMLCHVVVGDGSAEEASKFWRGNKRRLNLGAYQLFRAQEHAGRARGERALPEEKIAVGVADVLARCGLQASAIGGNLRNEGGDRITCIATVSSLYIQLGAENLEWVLRVVREGLPMAQATAPLLNGIAVLRATFGDAIDRTRLVTVLSKMQLDEIDRQARLQKRHSMFALAAYYAFVIYDSYNLNLRVHDRLPMTTIAQLSMSLRSFRPRDIRTAGQAGSLRES